mmetsp:Transcript_8345/g.14005  ORF Transcript_8345/g.14005 Transcript_8345/m.14005 type:complete len:337 (+) Transcript_8345:66-1076(+)|eukprot:CAMPEP_0119303218 /NCGR_PEP_ID=MMETSP1333-20130426/4684_1 /TAXON_ID=418940 /ORGANISM="Scyphosphaera apsteinii, Strain RCC1455" /LENGTH=336 /DNA_ID=CAMNT_0007305829 /DNA_START=59 /DNA_END=1069 /DNA_ORIENTATION=-
MGKPEHNGKRSELQNDGSSSSLPSPPSYIEPGTTTRFLLPDGFPEPSADEQHPDQIISNCPRPPHSWTPCPGHAFNVRCGPNYALNGHKTASAAPLYDVYAVDVYQNAQKLPFVARVTSMPEDPSSSQLSLPPYLIFNILVPNYAPGGMLSQKRNNGPGWNLVLHCRLSEAARTSILEGRPSAAVDLLRRFMHPEDGAHLRKERLKIILGVVDFNEPGFNLVTKQLLQSYNFKPFLSKTASSFYLQPQRCFEIDVDIHSWSQAALSAFQMCKAKLSKTTVRVGVVIEAEGDEEMPEQVLAGIYLSYLDPSNAIDFTPELTAYLASEHGCTAALPKC